jgi:asparagine synthase (glutamine-hydrolysing)
VQFPDVAGADEVKEAQEAANVYDCRHTVVSVTGREVRDILPKFAGDLDQPSTDGFNTWLISRAAARDVKGVLSGIGGDEWFAGYPVTRRMVQFATTPRGKAQARLGNIAHQVAPWLPKGRLRDKFESLAARRTGLATWLQAHSVFRYTLARQMAGLSAMPEMEPALLAAVLEWDVDDWTKETMVGLSCLLDTRVYMISQLLRDSDASSMAHSLELRVPLVDLALVAFTRTCLDEYKLRSTASGGGRYQESGSKRVLIHALRDVLPLSISTRKKKGFSLPYATWMRGELADLVEDTCGAESLKRRGLIDPQLVGNAHDGAMYPNTWGLLIFELWCRNVLDRYQQPVPAIQGVRVA